MQLQKWYMQFQNIMTKSDKITVSVYSALGRLHLEYWVQFEDFLGRILINCPKDSSQNDKRVRKSCKEWLEALDVFSLKRKELQVNLMIVFSYLKSCHLEDRAELFKIIPEDRTRYNRFKSKD